MRSTSDRCLREFAFNLANQNFAIRSRFFRPIPAAFQTKPKRFVLGLAENVVLFKLTFPIREPPPPPPAAFLSGRFFAGIFGSPDTNTPA